MRATYNPLDALQPATLNRFWTRATYWDDGETVDNPAGSADEAKRIAKRASLDLRADVDAMDDATVLATYRRGIEQ